MIIIPVSLHSLVFLEPASLMKQELFKGSAVPYSLLIVPRYYLFTTLQYL